MSFPTFKPNQTLDTVDFQTGTTLLINKPLRWTSFDVVNKVRSRLKHFLGAKKIKVGHSGTLDPLATGLLILCTGRATKSLNDLQGLDKVYSGTFHLGATTPSYDKETAPDKHFETNHITPELIEQLRQSFVGDIEQLPPMYSAIKVDGQPLYRKARKGVMVELKPRPVTIHEFEILSVEMPTIAFRVKCSKGTYIRSLAYDFGKALNSGAYLSSLVREKIDTYSLENAWDLEELVALLEQATP